MLRVGLAARFALTLVLTASLGASIRPALAAGDEAEVPCAKDANEVCTQDAWTEEDHFTRDLWGFFTSPKVRSRVVINNHPENDYPYLQFSNGPKHELSGSWVMASICRHQEAALDYIYIEPLVLGSGAVPIVKIYRIHPTTNAIELVYETDFLDDLASLSELYARLVMFPASCWFRTGAKGLGGPFMSSAPTNLLNSSGSGSEREFWGPFSTPMNQIAQRLSA